MGECVLRGSWRDPQRQQIVKNILTRLQEIYIQQVLIDCHKYSKIMNADNQQYDKVDSSQVTRYKAIFLVLYLTQLVSSVLKYPTWIYAKSAALRRATKKFNTYLKKKTKRKCEELEMPVKQKLEQLKKKLIKYTKYRLFRMGINEVMSIKNGQTQPEEELIQYMDLNQRKEQSKRLSKLKKNRSQTKESIKNPKTQERDKNNSNLDRYKKRLAILFYLKIPHLLDKFKSSQLDPKIKKWALELALTDFVHVHNRQADEFSLVHSIHHLNIQENFTNFVANTLSYTGSQFEEMMTEDILNHNAQLCPEERKKYMQHFIKMEAKALGRGQGQAVVDQIEHNSFGSAIRCGLCEIAIAIIGTFAALQIMRIIIEWRFIEIASVANELWLVAIIILVSVLLIMVCALAAQQILSKTTTPSPKLRPQ